MSETNLAGMPEELAGRWRRFGAGIIDFVIGAALTVPVLVLSGTLTTFLGDADFNFMQEAQFFVVNCAAFLAVHGYLLATRGQTVGMRMERIRMVCIDGRRISLPRICLLRYVLPWIIVGLPAVGPYLGLVNVLFIYRKDRRCLHDHLAGTKVICA